MKFGFDWPSGFREEDLWNCGQTTDGRTPEHGHPIRYTGCQPSLLKNIGVYIGIFLRNIGGFSTF